MIAQVAMFAACACYCVAATAYYFEGKDWMGTTMLLYAASVLTVWMAGTK